MALEGTDEEVMMGDDDDDEEEEWAKEEEKEEEDSTRRSRRHLDVAIDRLLQILLRHTNVRRRICMIFSPVRIAQRLKIMSISQLVFSLIRTYDPI